MSIEIRSSVSKLVTGHVLDVAQSGLVSTLRRYDPLLYVKWNPKKKGGRGVWELRRKPEQKSIRESRFLDTPRGMVFHKGDIFEFDGFTIVEPKYHENSFENHVKDFDYLTYDMVTWLADHDLWKHGYKGKYVTAESDYREAKYLEKIDEDSDSERQYMIKQHRTQFQDFAAYINAGGNPAELIRHWGQ